MENDILEVERQRQEIIKRIPKKIQRKNRASNSNKTRTKKRRK